LVAGRLAGHACVPVEHFVVEPEAGVITRRLPNTRKLQTLDPAILIREREDGRVEHCDRSGAVSVEDNPLAVRASVKIMEENYWVLRLNGWWLV
jgi:hypothetical protein